MLHLYSYQGCPFARRTRMTLIEKGLQQGRDFELTEIDIKNKPDNFTEISPYGKVPVLLHAGGRIYESVIINEYLDETFRQPALLPGEAMQKAQARIWMDYCDRKLADASWQFITAKNDADKCAARDQLNECMLFIEHEGLRKLSDGPFWLGADISLVDIQFLPFFQSYLNNDRQDIPDECSRINGWLDAMVTRASYLETLARKAA